MTILIAGMHRSGTSATAHVLSAVGFDLGAPELLLPATDDNRSGYFELAEVASLNDELLRRVNGHWFAPLHQPEKMAALANGPLGDRARRIIATHSNERAALKDPRFMVTLPFWSRILGAPEPTSVVVVFRNPAAVAASLHSRDDLPESYGLLLWRTYHQHLAAAISDLSSPPTVEFVNFDELVTNPGPTVEALCGLAPWTVDPAAQRAAIDVVATQDRHHSGDTEVTDAKALALWQALRDNRWPDPTLEQLTDSDHTAIEVAAALGDALQTAQHETRKRKALEAELESFRSSTMGRISTSVWDAAAAARKLRDQRR